MADTATYTVTMGVLDKFSQTILDFEGKLQKLGRVGESTKKKLEASPTEKLWSQMTGAVSELHKKFGELGDSISEMGKRLGEVLPMVGAIGGAASVAGLIEMTHATAEAAETLNKMAKITGASVPELQAVSYAAGQVGVSADTLSAAFTRANTNIGRAASGQSKNVAAVFQKMGISLRDANGHVKSITDILPQLESGFAKTTDPATRSSDALAIFGRNIDEMMPFLTEGPDALEEFEAKFKKFGYGFSPEDKEGLDKFNESWKDAQLSIQGLSDKISAELAPVMAPLLEDFATFVADNRDLVAADLKDAIATISNALKKIDFKKISDDARGFVDVVDSIVDKVGGWGNVLAGVGGVIALNFMSPALSFGFGLGKIAVQLASFAAGPVMSLVVAFGKAVPAIGSASEAFAALGAAVAANPLGAIIAATAALAFGAYELWKHWQQVQDFFKPFLAWLGPAFHAVFDPIENTLNSVGTTIQNLFGGGPQPAPGTAGSTPLSRYPNLAKLQHPAAPTISPLNLPDGPNADSWANPAPQPSPPGAATSAVAKVADIVSNIPNPLPPPPPPAPADQDDPDLAKLQKLGAQYQTGQGDAGPSAQQNYEALKAAQAQAAATAAAQQQGGQRIDVYFNNAPDGMRVVASASGGALPPVIHNTGQNGTTSNHQDHR